MQISPPAVSTSRFTGSSFVQALSLATIAILLVIAYHASMENGFTFDDRAIIIQNDMVSNQRWKEIFTSGYWQGFTGVSEGLYRPLTVGSYALNHWVAGPSPAVFHFSNLVFHLFVTGTLFFLARSLMSPAASFVAGGLFAVHPVLSEAVNSVVGRAELLAACFGFLALLLWGQSLGQFRRDLGRGIAVFALLMASQLSKESGFLLAGSLTLAAVILRARFECWIPPMAATIGGPLVKWGVIGSLLPSGIGFLDNPLAYTDSMVRMLNGFGIVVRYIKLLVFPWPLAADYSYNQIRSLELADLASWLPILAVVSLGWVACSGKVWRQRGFTLIAVSTGAVIGISNTFIVIGTIFAERLLYVPAAGFALLTGWALTQLPNSATRIIVPAISIVISTVLVAAQTTIWRDDSTLFEHAARINGNSARTHFGYGLALHRNGELTKALGEYDKALKIYPRYAEAHYNRGGALLRLKRRYEALEAYERAAAARPAYVEALRAAAILSKKLRKTRSPRVGTRPIELPSPAGRLGPPARVIIPRRQR